MKLRIQPLHLSVLAFLLLTLGQINAQQSGKKKIAGDRSPAASKVTFVSGNSSLSIPFELSNNLILIRARVSDSGPLWFIFDTGAESTVIDVQLAKDLRLKSKGKVVGTGAAGSAEAALIRGVSLHLPNVAANDLTVYALPIDSFSFSFGRKISGVIGNDIIKEFVVEVDYASHVVNLWEPRSYQYSGNGEIIPFTIEGKLPFIRATISINERISIEGKFEIDSGSTSAILFNAPFVKKHQLLKSVPKTKQIKVGGVGGTGNTLLGRIKKVKIGRLVLENPVARFYQDKGGDNASAKYDGLIGGEFLRRFNVIFDFSRRRAIFEPNAQIADLYEVDMSGLEVVADGDDYSIMLIDDIEPNSPAAEAGIEGGDVITAIDGRPAKEFTLDQIRQMFKQDGREYLLSLKRNEKTLQAKIKLRRSL